MAISREQRRDDRRERVLAAIDEWQADAALDMLEPVEFAWHDCDGDMSPSELVVDDVLTVSAGRVDRLVAAGLLAVKDWRGLRLAVDDLRARP